MGEDEHTTVAVQRYLNSLAEDTADDSVVRELLARSAHRLRLLCANLLHRGYPRLTRPPLNLQQDELLSALVERLLKALRTIHPQTVRQFFALANRHMRWELNDLARRLDEQPRAFELREAMAAEPSSTVSGPSPKTRRILQAIEGLPDDEREVFSLVRIQGMTHGEAASVLEASAKTVQRRLNRALVLLAEQLGDLRPPPGTPGEP